MTDNTNKNGETMTQEQTAEQERLQDNHKHAEAVLASVLVIARDLALLVADSMPEGLVRTMLEDKVAQRFPPMDIWYNEEALPPVQPFKRSIEEVYSLKDVAAVCKVAPRTVSKWFDSGRLVGNTCLATVERTVPHANLLHFLQEHQLPLGPLGPPSAIDYEEHYVNELRKLLPAQGQLALVVIGEGPEVTAELTPVVLGPFGPDVDAVAEYADRYAQLMAPKSEASSITVICVPLHMPVDLTPAGTPKTGKPAD